MVTRKRKKNLAKTDLPCVDTGSDADKEQLVQMMSWSRKDMSDSWWAGVERLICGHIFYFLAVLNYVFAHHYAFHYVISRWTEMDLLQVKVQDQLYIHPVFVDMIYQV